jgi:hypothetical protein
MFARIDAAAAAFVPALIVEVSLSQFTQLLHGRGTEYGAPLPVGRGPESLLFSSGPTTFEFVPFAVNVVITWALLLAVARWAGLIAAVMAIPAGILSLAAALAMGFATDRYAGIPVPAFDGSPVPTSLTLWLDMLLWTVAVAVLIRRRRARPT